MEVLKEKKGKANAEIHKLQRMTIPLGFRRMTLITHREGFSLDLGHALSDTPILKAVSLSTILFLFLPVFVLLIPISHHQVWSTSLNLRNMCTFLSPFGCWINNQVCLKLTPRCPWFAYSHGTTCCKAYKTKQYNLDQIIERVKLWENIIDMFHKNIHE